MNEQILTIKIKHSHDLSLQLNKAKEIAEFALKNKDKRSSKDVKYIGLSSAIANQILRKYGRNKKAKTIKSVKLTVPNQAIRFNNENIEIKCLDLKLPNNIKYNFIKINQIEIDEIYCYVSISVNCHDLVETSNYIGIDMNTTGHCCVVGNPLTGKILKLGKQSRYIHIKYKNIRKKLQKTKKFKQVKQIKDREYRIIKDLNHKISRKVVNYAKDANCGIKLEELKNIRKTVKVVQSFKYSLNSWAYYQLRKMIEYKASLLGIQVDYIHPAYTSKSCSRCGLIGNRSGKSFKCPNCGYVEHADVNAAFNIATSLKHVRFGGERDSSKGRTDTPKRQRNIKQVPALKPCRLALGCVS